MTGNYSLPTCTANPCSTSSKEKNRWDSTTTPHYQTATSRLGTDQALAPNYQQHPQTAKFSLQMQKHKGNQTGIKMHFGPFSSPKSFTENYDHLVCFRKRGRAVLKKPSVWVAWTLQSFQLRSGFYLNCKAQGILQDHRKLFRESILKSRCWKSRAAYSRPEPRLPTRADRSGAAIQQRMSVLANDFARALEVFAPVLWVTSRPWHCSLF